MRDLIGQKCTIYCTRRHISVVVTKTEDLETEGVRSQILVFRITKTNWSRRNFGKLT